MAPVKYYTLQEVAQMLGLSYGTVRQYVHYGKIRATKRGKYRLVAQSDLNEFQSRRMTRSRPS